MAKASQARNERRAVRSADGKRKLKRKPKQNDLLVRQSELKEYAKVADVNKAYQQLSDNHEAFGKLFNANMGEIKTSFTMTDSWHHIFRRVMNDMVKGNVETNEEGIAWDWYFKQYGAVAAFANAVAALAKKSEPEKDEPATPKREYTEDLVFGGDHANQNSPPG